MAFIAPLLTGISALGGLFGNRPQTQQQAGTQSQFGGGTQTGYNQQTGSVSGQTTGQTNIAPVLNPLAQTGYESIAQKYMDLLSSDPNLKGYEAGQTSDINKLASLQRKNVEENLASRGITGPAAGAATNAVESQRIGQISQVHQQMPLLLHSILTQTLNDASNFFRGMPVGQQTTQAGTTAEQQQQMVNTGQTQNQYGTTNQTGNITTPGNMLGGLFGGAGNALSLLAGLGAFNKSPQYQPVYQPSNTGGSGYYGPWQQP